MRPVHPGLTGRQHDMVQSMRALGIGTEEFDPVGDGPYGEGMETKMGEWTLGDLNPRPSGCKPDALPTELSAR